MKGIIQKYFTGKGYGFIKGEDEKSYFFHISDTNLDKKFRYDLDDVEVEFEPDEVRNTLGTKMQAKNVKFDTNLL